MKASTVLALGGFVLAICLAVLLATHEAGLGRRADGSFGLRSWSAEAGHEAPVASTRPFAFVFEDPSDRKVFQECGYWLPSGLTPYTEVQSYYPQISTWLMGVPYLFFEHGIDASAPPVPPDKTNKADKGSPEYRAQVLANRIPYGDWHEVMMGLFYFALLVLLVLALRELGHAPAWALLLLLPASLYFGFNRFDLVVTCFVIGALLLQIRGRRRAAAVVLGLAIMTKWYPIVLVPLFLSNNLHSERARRLARGEAAPWIPLFLQQVIVPGLVTVAACLPILAITYFQNGGGMEAATALFRYHETFEPNHSSLFAMSTNSTRLGWLTMQDREWMQPWFGRLQVIPAALLALLPLRSLRSLIFACLGATLSLILFHIFFSPQWVVIWAAALAILVAPRSRTTAVLVAVLGVLMYVQTPLLYYSAQYFVADGQNDAPFWAVSKVRLFLVIGFWLFALVAAVRTALVDREPERLGASARADALPEPA